MVSTFSGDDTNLFYEPNKSRWVIDAIHGFIEFDQNTWNIIDTPQFQRLREIKQLGASHYVFPGGRHSRFEHCLGTAHLSNVLYDYLEKSHDNKYNELGFEDQNEFKKYKTISQIAGLCHDLGHGPYSHMFDNELLPRLGENNWKHEDGSVMMLNSLFEENQILAQYADDNFTKNELDLIGKLIQGDVIKEKHPEWIYEVISNKKNSIDVDKFDYMKRDAYHIGLNGFDFDYNTVMRETRVIDQTLAYHHKHCYNIYDLFGNRYKLFKQIYQHRVTQGIELMLCDVLYEVNNMYKFKEIIQDPKQYLYLNDNIINEIQRSKDPRALNSQKLLDQINKRNVYRYVTEQLVEGDKQVNKQEIIKYISSTQKVDEGKIHVITCKSSYCMGDKNPVDSVDFYKQPYQKTKIKADAISLILPNKFEEKHVRVFIKEDDHQQQVTLMGKIKTGFKQYSEERFNKKELTGIEKQNNSKRKRTTNYSDFSQQLKSFNNTPIKKPKTEEQYEIINQTR